MNKNAIKKFATEARRELISRVSQRALKYGISDKEVGNPMMIVWVGICFLLPRRSRELP